MNYQSINELTPTIKNLSPKDKKSWKALGVGVKDLKRLMRIIASTLDYDSEDSTSVTKRKGVSLGKDVASYVLKEYIGAGSSTLRRFLHDTNDAMIFSRWKRHDHKINGEPTDGSFDYSRGVGGKDGNKQLRDLTSLIGELWVETLTLK